MDDRNEELRNIMREHKLKTRDVARLLNREPITVRIWLCQGEKTTRVIPAETLELLKMKLAAQQA
ncbi:hypothetical protein [Bradyrhizobium sp. BWC-3-1]|uniref:hypothetical protein n=1 Tax=Bradyrhizobium sp. BWC-3-1 TaxID=3080012 RepID=UPI00293E3046|nr:hypothetical protein [Bradyrhizobium sp. BWC-3-1]WOH61936.1 hypothetical protein RX329_18315 [Bradyrhizobium sp. BWC-3-1]